MYTSKTANVRVLIPWLFALVFAGCGGAQRRKDGTEDLTRIQDAVQGLQILVSAGLTKAEYSQRLEDMLLKVGDLNGSQNQTVPKFPQKDQGTVREIYTHLSKSIDAYKTARDYFGDKFNGPGCEDGCMTLSQQDYETEKATALLTGRDKYYVVLRIPRFNFSCYRGLFLHLLKRAPFAAALRTGKGRMKDDGRQAKGKRNSNRY